jgi:hypothetical protein
MNIKLEKTPPSSQVSRLFLSHHQTCSKDIQTKETQKPRPIKPKISDQIRDLFQLSKVYEQN